MTKSIDVYVLQGDSKPIPIQKLKDGSSVKLYEIGIADNKSLFYRHASGKTYGAAEKVSISIGLGALLRIQNKGGIAKIKYGADKLEFTETTNLQISDGTKIRLEYS